MSSAQHLTEELRNKGYLTKNENIARGIVPTFGSTRQIFTLGRIAAGTPIEPIEVPEPIDVPSSLISKPGNYYALEVVGSSMIEDNILEGDTIIIRHEQVARDGETVVAITENGATLKVFRNNNGSIYLEPRNKNLLPIYPKGLEIRGIYCGLIRQDKS